jgi:hypothetical protein
MHLLTKSTTPSSSAVDRYCPIKQSQVHASFCSHVCSYQNDCAIKTPDSSNAFQRVDSIIPLTTADLAQLTQLGINPLQPQGQNLNCIQDQFLQDPQRTKQQVHALREIPWIHHQAASEWPQCDCLACCGALIITIIENAAVTE